jgi:hypothetical protein
MREIEHKEASVETTELSRFDAALSKIMSVSHAELKRREAEWKKQKAAKKQAKSKA